MFPISIAKEQALLDRMRRWGVCEADIRENFVRSQGKGGQKVNKTSSCVFLVHLPTGIQIKCQIDRSQAMNRFLARRMLIDKIEARELGQASAERSRVEKIRRQKRRRSRRAKDKMLQVKKERSEIKGLRRTPNPDVD